MDIFEKKILLFGTGGSGKTTFATKVLWNAFKCPLAYDINGDFGQCPGGIAYNPQDIAGEFIAFLDFYFKTTAKHKIDAIFFDDADAYITYEIMNEPKFRDLIVRHRNKYGVTLVFISKRPQNLPTWIVENYHIAFIFLIEGYNAVKRLDDMDVRITPLLNNLKPHEYIIKVEGQAPTLQKPINL
ncbi:ATP-binding protein [Candidatus Woesearchaeota archaeon]|nr:ATP-binding protein [Candidatus Woesearchaeota archaeon]